MPKNAKGITEEKAKRIAVGATVAGVLLVIFLVIIMIVQFVSMGVAGARERELDEQIAEYERRIEEGERDLDWYKYGGGLYYLARQMGKQ